MLTDLKETIDSSLKGPLFDVHITLCGPFATFDKRARKKLKDITRELAPIRLISDGIQTKQEFFQSLFIKIKETDDLLDFKKKIDGHFLVPAKEYFPHISLHYGDKDQELKTRATKQLKKFNNTFLLEKISLVEVDESISSWKILESYPLIKLKR